MTGTMTPVTTRSQKLRQQQSSGHCDCTGLRKATPLTALCTKVSQVSRPGYPVFVAKDAASWWWFRWADEELDERLYSGMVVMGWSLKMKTIQRRLWGWGTQWSSHMEVDEHQWWWAERLMPHIGRHFCHRYMSWASGVSQPIKTRTSL